VSSELEQRLVALGAALEFPPPPDVVASVTPRLPERRGQRERHAPRALAAVLAVGLALAGGALAVTPIRHAILRVLGLRGVSIERVQRLPPAPASAGARLGLGERIPLSRVRHAAAFTALLPARPTAAYLEHDVLGGRVSLLAGRVLIIEFRAAAIPFIFKLIGPGTRAQPVRVNGGPGVYLSGALHVVIFQDSNGQLHTDRVRLAGNVLIWQQGALTVRIEGTHALTQALDVAGSLR
jgi:hypothetical protein